jgi:hypothetical protein
MIESQSFLRGEIQADNKMKLGLEQVGKGGLPPLLGHVESNPPAGVNHPSRLVLFEGLRF